MTAGFSHACAVTAGGAVVCWGENSAGQLGNGTTRDSAEPVTAIPSGAIQVSAERDTTCAVLTAGEVRCWGANHAGQVGDGTTENALTPVTALSSGAESVVATAHFLSCARTEANEIRCWGEWRRDGGYPEPNPPFTVTSGAVRYADNLCAVFDQGEVKCWGEFLVPDKDGAHAEYYETPVSLGIRGVSQLSHGVSHWCGVFAGPVKCWGSRIYGNMGDGARDRPSNGLVSKPVTAIAGGASQVSAGKDTTCAVVSGAIKCWGENDNSQLGDGTRLNSAVPINVTPTK